MPEVVRRSGLGQFPVVRRNSAELWRYGCLAFLGAIAGLLTQAALPDPLQEFVQERVVRATGVLPLRLPPAPGSACLESEFC